MLRSVQLPLWLLILILGFAAVTFASHFLFPSVRWFLRARAERALARLNARLDRPIDLFKLAARQDMIARLTYDPQVLQAATDEARARHVPGAVALEEAKRYAREIVPAFSATVYFGFATRVARWLSRALYRVEITPPDLGPGTVDPRSTVIFVMNHRSNMDYVLITWLAAERSALSYAVGEWARVWPLSALIRAAGAYFIRRGSRTPLYRRVLARYVQISTEEGVTQGIFPEGGLSLNGRVGPAKMGLLSYVAAGFDPARRDVVFIPVGLAYDRVLEDDVLTRAGQAGNRRFKGRAGAILAFVWDLLWRRLSRQQPPYGTAAAAYGPPMSLKDFFARHPGASVEDLGNHLMAEIERAVPVLPVPLVAAALRQGPGDAASVLQRIAALRQQLIGFGAGLRLKSDDAATLEAGSRLLRERGILGRDGALLPGQDRLLAFYAAPVEQRIGQPEV
jgi:glycerol-3-phosphate O-acyltransferase